MGQDRSFDLRLDLAGISILVVLFVVALFTTDVLYQSLLYQIATGSAAAMAIYLMLRMGLLAFTVPAFMAIGGYAAAIVAKSGPTDILLLGAVSIVVPMLFAAPLGALVLRLRGVYFILVTFIFNEITQILLFELPGITGGANGILDVPPASLPGLDLGSASQLVMVSVALAIAAAVGTLAVSHRFRPEFAAIDENETLAVSLGLTVWRYRTIGFIASAGVAGLAGFALVNMLATANPTSFSSWTVNNYIAYVFVGGRGTIAGVVVGTVLLTVMSNIFSGYANLSAGLFGLLLIAVMLIAPSGIVGALTLALRGRRRAARAEA